MRNALIAAAMVALALSAAASGQRSQRPLESAYTPLDLDRCTQVSTVEEGESAAWRCPGYGGVPLIVLSGDGRFDIDAGADNGVWESDAAFNHPGPRVEWRQRRGARPHAIIYRLLLTGDGNQGRSVLGVETISYPVRESGSEGWAGCLVAWIDGGVPDANALARRIADRMDRRFQCGHSEPQQVARAR